MPCEGKKCTAQWDMYENPDLTHPFDNPNSTFIVKRGNKQVYTQTVYELAAAEFKKIIASLNKASIVKDSCEKGCVCEIEYEKRVKAKRVNLPPVGVQVTVTVGTSVTSIDYVATTTADLVTWKGIGECNKSNN